MKILVAVKEVAELAEQFDISGITIGEEYFQYDLNEWDSYAIEEAVQLNEAGLADEVVIATIGPERSEETIRTALAKGADRAVRVWDEALDDIEVLDLHGKVELLAAVVEHEEPDIVLTGVQAGDDQFGATGVALAERLEFGWAAVVNDLEVDSSGETISVRRELEGGIEELANVDVPAVLTIQTGINDPRYASLRSIRQAQRKEITTLSLEELGMNSSVVESPLELLGMAEPETEGTATYFEGEPEESASALASLLEGAGVVEI
ncbi:electron transfer flavoprotein subunit beta/FixA family protein [Natrarchaeobius chitinivorans]|uniref:Electron transfer flavoprotein subunit beta/FixA family protein n=1 Tax=Natrarchaeobius chitinivorans TaxID=1679083 RepID=A0A3N6LXC2_NATCH|nr:electron transfer flavoprotein subunit beta/FixA family protein [Natrarchaeobius chitinivorans]RQG95408.1 electron transfer flavoprotein subunit beta/FixA family protein [Natrarchaeobius chitinivorans]